MKNEEKKYNTILTEKHKQKENNKNPETMPKERNHKRRQKDERKNVEEFKKIKRIQRRNKRREKRGGSDE